MRHRFTSLHALKQHQLGSMFFTQSWVYAGVTSWFSKNNRLSDLQFVPAWIDPIVYDSQDNCPSGITGNVFEGHIDYWWQKKFEHCRFIITGHRHHTMHATGVTSLGFDYWDINTLTEFGNPILYHEINRASVATAEYDLVVPVGRLRPHRLQFLQMLNDAQLGLTIVTDNRQKILPTDLKFYELGIEVYLNKFDIKSPADIFDTSPTATSHRHSFFDQHTGRSVDHLPHKKMHSIARVNVILETTVKDVGSVFLTEKTYKVLANHRPFVILGDTHALAKLRLQGFKTFDKFCDESYDQESDLHQRMLKVLQACSQLAEATKHHADEIDTVCRHNQARFFDRQRHNDNLAQFGKLCLDTIYR